MITKRDIHCIALTERRIGVENGIAMMVKSMKEKGLPLDVIACVSGWSEEEIKNCPDV